MGRNDTENDGLLDLNRAAEYLGVSPRSLRELCGRGLITHSRPTRKNWRFTKDALDAFLDRRTTRARSVYEWLDGLDLNEIESLEELI